MEAKLRELSLRNTLLIGLGLAAFYYFFLFNPPKVQIQVDAKKAQVATLEAEVKALDKKILEAENAEGELSQVKEEVLERAESFKLNLQPETVQRVISQEARAAGIFFESIGNSTSRRSNVTPDFSNEATSFSADDYIMRLSIKTNFKGTFEQVMRFLSYLTRTEQVISLYSLKIVSQISGAQVTQSKSPVLTFQAEFEAYGLVKDISSGLLESNQQPQAGGQ